MEYKSALKKFLLCGRRRFNGAYFEEDSDGYLIVRY